MDNGEWLMINGWDSLYKGPTIGWYTTHKSLIENP